MKAKCILIGLMVLASILTLAPSSGMAQRSLSPGYAATDAPYNASEAAGREIWFYATAFNHRFFSYSYPQRLGAVVDWYRVLHAEGRDQRFETWGIINNPDCCTPGTENCPAQSLDETYGFEWCPGDDVLLQFVGKEGYEEHDPACDFADAPFDESTAHGTVETPVRV